MLILVVVGAVLARGTIAEQTDIRDALLTLQQEIYRRSSQYGLSPNYLNLAGSMAEPNPSLMDILPLLTPLEGEVSQQCLEDSQLYAQQLNNTITNLLRGFSWALKMFDSSAKLPPSGLLQGSFKWMGNFESCLEVEGPRFKGQHCLVGFTYNPEQAEEASIRKKLQKLPQMFSSFLPTLLRKSGNTREEEPTMEEQLSLLAPYFRVGRCIPDSCTRKDVADGFTAAFQKFFNTTNFGVIVDTCHSADETIELDSADWVMITIIIVFGVLVTVGTLIDLAVQLLGAKYFGDGVLHTFVGFSAYTNTIKIFSTANVRPDSITCLNGIRFISMTWVLFSHAYSNFQQGLPITNSLTMSDPEGPVVGSVAFTAILNGFPSVDTFFFIGALLLSYLTLRELDKLKGGNAQFWVMYYVHRYIRLTGVYAMIIGFNATLLKFFATGPQSTPISMEVEGCKATWYYNIAYINNLKWVVDDLMVGCVGQSWYLACDMQFFLISPLIIVPLWAFPKIGLILGFGWVVAATVVPMMVVHSFELPMTVSMATSMEQVMEVFMEYYVSPFSRFQPYILGLLFGFLLHKMRDQPRLKINPHFIIWIWAIMGAVGSAVIYCMHPFYVRFYESQGVDSGASLADSVAYNGLHRVGWSVGLAWVILACMKGAGGPINTILSWHAWIPLARLSYTIYLVHMTILSYFSSLPSFSMEFSHALGVYWILAMLCFSIFVAYIVVILFEAPILHLEKLFFGLLGVGKRPAVSSKAPGGGESQEKKGEKVKEAVTGVVAVETAVEK